MVTKADLEERANEILDCEMEWSKMNKDDLELFVELLEEGAFIEPMALEVGKNKTKQIVDEKADEWEPGQLAAKLL